ncbi:hypothetical protein D3C81_1022180 [compost metagenome]
MGMNAERRLFGIFQHALCTGRVGRIDQCLILATDVQFTRKRCELVGHDRHWVAGRGNEYEFIAVEDDRLQALGVQPPGLRFRSLEVLHGAAQQ